MPSAITGTVCMELIKVISRLLDEALDYQQPIPSSSALPITANPHDTGNMDINSTNNTTTIPSQLPEEPDIPGSQQQQLQGLMPDGGPMESLWFGMGMEYSVGDDAFHDYWNISISAAAKIFDYQEPFQAQSKLQVSRVRTTAPKHIDTR
uniref:Uncharacterized protein n=2 Tax=Talaromyces marneffei PM1 TaxID=1077442 RepID=A0A093V8D3_TALMA